LHTVFTSVPSHAHPGETALHVTCGAGKHVPVAAQPSAVGKPQMPPEEHCVSEEHEAPLSPGAPLEPEAPPLLLLDDAPLLLPDVPPPLLVPLLDPDVPLPPDPPLELPVLPPPPEVAPLLALAPLLPPPLLPAPLLPPPPLDPPPPAPPSVATNVAPPQAEDAANTTPNETSPNVRVNRPMVILP
jgi:hypothetical protein